LQRYPNLIEPLNTRIKEILANGIKEDTQRYVRFILNEDVLSHVEKSVKEKNYLKAKKNSLMMLWLIF
jgi:hypothetical protein